MLKEVLSLWICFLAVSSYDFDEFSGPKNAKTGLIFSKSEEYSFISRDIECKKLDKMRRFYKGDTPVYIAKPQVEGNFESKLRDDSSQLCKMYLVNVVNIDQNSYLNSHPLIRAFQGFIYHLANQKFNKVFPISVESFAFQPSTLCFLFIDIDKLVLEEGPDEDKKPFIEKMSASFYESLLSKRTRYFQYDFKHILGSGANTSKVSENQIIKSTITSKDLYETIFVNDSKCKEANLKFEFKKDSSSTSVRITIASKTSQLIFDNKSERYAMYICINDSELDRCSSVDNSYFNANGSAKTISFNNNRYANLDLDVDIQETTYREDEKSEDLKKLFIVYLHLSNKFDSKLSLAKRLIFGYKFNPYEDEKDVIVCKTEAKKLIVGTVKDFSTQNQIFTMKNDITNLKGEGEVYQIAPSVLDERFKLCHEMDTKAYLIKGKDKQIVLTIERNKTELNSISFRKIETEVPIQTLMICNKNADHYDYQLDHNRRSLTVNNKSAKYPSQVVFRKDRQSKDTVESSCVSHSSPQNFFYLKEFRKEEKTKFKWNFNSHEIYLENNSENSDVYLSSSDNTIKAGFYFSDFVWPSSEAYTVFLSIVFDHVNTKYKVKAGFFKDNKELYEIVPKDDKNFEYSTYPHELIYSEKSSSSSTGSDSISFSNYNAAYMSDTEVVYQLKLSNFQNCYPKLVIEKDKKLQILCASCIAFCDGKKMDITKITHEGLKRVINQADPKNPNNSENSNANGKRNLRMVI